MTSRPFLIDGLVCALLSVLTFAIYARLFLHLPILLEARDFYYQFGWLQGASARALLWALVGGDGSVAALDNHHLASWTLFKWARLGFGFDCTLLNAIQFALLSVGTVVGYMHLRCLCFSRSLAAVTSFLWLASVPVMDAASWQATQNDKLAFIFSILALTVILSGIRSDSLRLSFLSNVLATLLTALAVNSKPIAFVLPGLFAAQVILFAPTPTWRSFVRSMVHVLGPVAFSAMFIARYFSRMTPKYHLHALEGSILRSLNVYLEAVYDHGGGAWQRYVALALVGICVLGGLGALSTTLLRFCRRRKDSAGRPPFGPSAGTTSRLAYFGLLFVATIIVLLRGNAPAPYYLLLPWFAFLASLATMGHVLKELAQRRGRMAGYVAQVSLLVLASFVINASIKAVTRPAGYAVKAARGRHVSDSYRWIRDNVDFSDVHAVTFILTTSAEEKWALWEYVGFFGMEGEANADRTVPSFVFEREMSVPFALLVDKPRAPRAGELVVEWTRRFVIRRAELSGRPIISWK